MMEDFSRRALYILRGAPGAGKTTYVEEHNLEKYTISPDVLRMQLSGPWWTLDGVGINQENNDKLFSRYFYPMLEERMRKNEFLIIDGTASTTKELKKYLSLANKYGYYPEIIDFTKVDIDICKKRNKRREKYKIVPDWVIDKMYHNFETQEIPDGYYIDTPEGMHDWFTDYIGLVGPTPIDHKNLFFVGDIHGCFDTFYNKVLKHKKKDSHLILLGDYFDRGPQQREMYQWLHENINNYDVTFLIGNHEARIRQWLRTGKVQSEAFQETLDEIGISKEEWREFYKKLWPYFCVDPSVDIKYSCIFATHGGLSDVAQVDKRTARYQFVHGIGRYEDVDKVCDSWNESAIRSIDSIKHNMCQVFGHRYSKEIQHGRSFDLCGNPENNGEIRWLSISPFTRKREREAKENGEISFNVRYGAEKTNYQNEDAIKKDTIKH